MLRTRSNRMIAFAVCALLPAAAAMADYRWIVDSAVGQFDKEDWALLKSTLADVLHEGSDVKSKDWENPASGHGGKITVMKEYQSDDGKPCKLIRFNNHAGSLTGSSRYDVCRNPDGAWLEASSGMPFKLAEK